MINVKNLSKSFGGIKALDNVTLNINEGKITAIIGPNGSGKTTLFNVISRIIKEDSGEVILNGKNLCKIKDYEASNEGLSRTFQDVKLFKNLTIKDHMNIVLRKDNEKIMKSLFGKKEDNTRIIQEILDVVGLEKDMKTIVSELSYGQRKLLDFAIALAKKHTIIMLDEPVAGINPALRTQMKKTLKNLRRKGETIALIEHDMNFVMGLADYVYVLDYGNIIAEGKPKKIQKNKKVLEAYLGGGNA